MSVRKKRNIKGEKNPLEEEKKHKFYEKFVERVKIHNLQYPEYIREKQLYEAEISEIKKQLVYIKGKLDRLNNEYADNYCVHSWENILNSDGTIIEVIQPHNNVCCTHCDKKFRGCLCRGCDPPGN